MQQVLVLAATVGEGARRLPMTPEMFAAIAILAFISLLGLTWTFRGVSNKHR